jgi:thiamine biosynthesis protein ThiS
MRIVVNGEERELAGEATVSDLLGNLGLEVEGIAIAVNMEIVRRGDYAGTKFAEGDEVEIVRAVGGG